jgi:hypothetical protein
MCCTAQAQGPDTLIFGTTHERARPPTTTPSTICTTCAEIQQRCQLQSLPGRRGTAMLADGSIVGELGRVKEYKEVHPEYQRVEEPFIILRTMHARQPAGGQQLGGRGAQGCAPSATGAACITIKSGWKHRRCCRAAGQAAEELALHLYLGKDYTVLMPSITEAVKRLNAQGLRTRLHKKYFISP